MKEMSKETATILQNLKTPVAVLLGGRSAEREVSLQSGEAVLAAFRRQGIACLAIDTAEDQWLLQLAEHCEHAFIALHGVGGEDGTVQGALETVGISYTGSGVMASALAMDKLRCKQLWRGIGLPTPDFFVLEADSDWPQMMAQLGTAIVKPAREGSSIGMAKVSTAAELAAAYQAAARFDHLVIAERWITGAEFTVAILADRALPPIRLETDHVFYDYDAKYLADDTRYICPCGLPEAEQSQLQNLALQAFNSLGCSGWGRVDFMQSEDGQFYLLEVNTVPGMTSHSLVPMAAKAEGLGFDELVMEILVASLEARV